MIKFSSHLSEAFDIIPASEVEIDNLDHLSDSQKENLKKLYQHIVSVTGAPSPLALSKSPKEKAIKVQRAIAVDLDLPKLSKDYGFKLSAGNGTRGGGGANSQGFAFEVQIANDLEEYKRSGLDGEFKFPNMIQKMHDSFLKDSSFIEVKMEGAANTKRPLVFGDVKAVIGGRDLNIGHKVTDITVVTDKGPHYLSAKFGGTVTFFNAGVATIFREDEFQAGKITNKDAKKLLNMFGINEERFIETFTKYDPKTAKRSGRKTAMDVTSFANKRALQRLLLTGIGYGYWMVHRKGKNVEFYEMTAGRMKKSSTIQSIKVLYPQPGEAKRIDIEVVTPLYIFKFNIRNKQGGLYPSHLMCDYKPNPAGK
jgi:hypothetical protein